jgi:hypothetical protein
MPTPNHVELRVDTSAYSIAETPEDEAEATTTLSPPAELDRESFVRGLYTASMTGSAMAVCGHCLWALGYEKAGVACYSVLTAIGLGMMTCLGHKALEERRYEQERAAWVRALREQQRGQDTA